MNTRYQQKLQHSITAKDSKMPIADERFRPIRYGTIHFAAPAAAALQTMAQPHQARSASSAWTIKQLPIYFS